MTNDSGNTPPFNLRSVLASTDFSEVASHGVSVAARLAQRSGATLHIVHAVDVTYSTGTIGATTTLLDELHEEARKQLEHLERKLAQDGLEIDLKLRGQSAVEALLKESDKVEADLIVLCTHGRTGLAHTLLGSTAEHILQRTCRPVLSLHTADTLPDATPRRILIPTDLSGDALVALEGAHRLLGAQPGETSIHLLHAIEHPGRYGTEVGADSWSQMTERLTQAAEKLLTKIANSMRDEGYSVDTTARLGSAAAVILDAVETFDPDAVAMRTAEHSTLGRLFLGSTARRVVQKAHCPVLTIRWSPTAEG